MNEDNCEHSDCHKEAYNDTDIEVSTLDRVCDLPVHDHDSNCDDIFSG